MRCKICQNEFTPSKYRPGQQACSRPECQKARQVQNERAWRQKNPDYFKSQGQEVSWQQKRRRYSYLWKKTHPNELKIYAQNRKEKRREYMREYMRRRRLTLAVNRSKT
jgi:hypothetical protein